MSTVVEVYIDQLKFKYWESISINKNLESVADSFDLSATKIDLNLDNDSLIQIYIDGRLFLTGYPDRITESVDSSGTSFSVSGRSRTGALVDCSKVDPPFSYKSMTINSVAEIICRELSIFVESETVSRVIKSMTIDIGESYFDFLERYSRKEKIFLRSTVAGNLLIQPIGGRDKYFSGLELGKNVLSVTREKNYTNVFSIYKIRGQSGIKSNSVQSQAYDFTINRYKPKAIQSNDKTTTAEAKTRAEWEQKIRQARSIEISVDVQSWYILDQLIEINTIVNLDGDPYLITEASYKQDSGGTSASLKLKPKGAYE